MNFAHCSSIGLYPIVDSSLWVERLLRLGVKTIQLRIKDVNRDLRAEIHNSIQLAKAYQARLFINDYWQLAIEYAAPGVHLGQQDIEHADVAAIHKAGLLLGISTHNQEEVDRALALQPSYIACGPIFPTTTKIMPYHPQGINALRTWRAQLQLPLVAIGGINRERIQEVIATGVEGVAVISAITKAADPDRATTSLLQQF